VDKIGGQLVPRTVVAAAPAGRPIRAAVDGGRTVAGMTTPDTEPPDEGGPKPLRLDDSALLPDRAAGDTDAAWGEGPAPDAASETRRYLADKPPHHG
jgi:hypothetical protein